MIESESFHLSPLSFQDISGCYYAQHLITSGKIGETISNYHPQEVDTLASTIDFLQTSKFERIASSVKKYRNWFENKILQDQETVCGSVPQDRQGKTLIPEAEIIYDLKKQAKDGKFLQAVLLEGGKADGKVILFYQEPEYQLENEYFDYLTDNIYLSPDGLLGIETNYLLYKGVRRRSGWYRYRLKRSLQNTTVPSGIWQTMTKVEDIMDWFSHCAGVPSFY